MKKSDHSLSEIIRNETIRRAQDDRRYIADPTDERWNEIRETVADEFAQGDNTAQAFRRAGVRI